MWPSVSFKTLSARVECFGWLEPLVGWPSVQKRGLVESTALAESDAASPQPLRKARLSGTLVEIVALPQVRGTASKLKRVLTESRRLSARVAASRKPGTLA